METVFARSGVTPEDVLASKKHTDAVLASTSEKVCSGCCCNMMCMLLGPGWHLALLVTTSQVHAVRLHRLIIS